MLGGTYFTDHVHAFFTGIYDVLMLFCNRLRMEVQVCGYVWTSKNDVPRLRVDAETFENGKKTLRFQVSGHVWTGLKFVVIL